MISKISVRAALLSAAALVAGCASDGSLTTSSLTDDSAAKVAAGPKVDPACVQLAAQIDSLRQEGSVGRLEKAADGKSASVQVRRTTLAKQAELNKANAEFQARCGTVKPSTAAAAPAPAAPAAATPPAKPAAKPTAAAPAGDAAVKTVATAPAAATTGQQ
jgi:hypothetical protein